MLIHFRGIFNVFLRSPETPAHALGAHDFAPPRACKQAAATREVKASGRTRGASVEGKGEGEGEGEKAPIHPRLEVSQLCVPRTYFPRGDSQSLGLWPPKCEGRN
jgi:hypothetical protein